MTRVVILYPNANDNWLDKNYFVNKHIPLVLERLEPYGLVKFEFDTGVAGLNGPPPYLAIGFLSFASFEHFQKAMDAEGQMLMDDIPNYTRDYVLQVGETADVMQTASL